MKRCANCLHTLAPDRFDPMDAAPDGLHPVCRVCLARDPALNRGRCRVCTSRRMLSMFPGLDTSRPCLVCVPAVGAHCGAENLIGLLEAGGIRSGGPVRTVTELLGELGVKRPDKTALNAAARWLRSAGFQEVRTPGRKGFRVSVTGEAADNTFRYWAETYRALAALQLSDQDRDRYMRGVQPPIAVRLAMSALVAGLPPFSSDRSGPQ